MLMLPLCAPSLISTPPLSLPSSAAGGGSRGGPSTARGEPRAAGKTDGRGGGGASYSKVREGVKDSIVSAGIDSHSHEYPVTVMINDAF